MTDPDSSLYPLPAPFADWPRPLAFVLSGGGAYGAVQIGMLRALAARGIQPDLIVGTSIGAVHGAALSAGGIKTLDEMAGRWLEATRASVFGPAASVGWSLLRRGSLFSPNRLEALLTEQLPPSFVELQRPFAAVVTDLVTGESQLISSGRLVPAVIASCSIPGVFPSVELGGRLYIDGGISANVPIRQAIAFGAQSVLVLDATPQLPDRPSTRLPRRLLHATSLLIRNQRAHVVDDLRDRHRIVALPLITPPDVFSLDFRRTAELLEMGEKATAATLDDWVCNEPPTGTVA